MLPKVKSVKPKRNYQLLLNFENGENRIFDVKPYLKTEAFKELKTPGLFKSVSIKDGAVQWKNLVDFSSEVLYLKSREYTQNFIMMDLLVL